MTSNLPTRADGPASSRTFRLLQARSSRSRKRTSRAAPNRPRRIQAREAASKIHAEQNPRLVALEIDEVERTGRRRRLTRDLRAPRRRDPRLFGKFHVDRRSDEKALSGERIQAKAVIFAQVAGFAADEDSGMNLSHHADRDASGELLRPGPGHVRTHGFGLVEQVECRD